MGRVASRRRTRPRPRVRLRDCRTTRADGFGVDVDGADARAALLVAIGRRDAFFRVPRTTRCHGADDLRLGRRGMRHQTHAARLRQRVRGSARARVLAAPNLSLAVRGGLEREPRASRDLQRNGSRRRRQNRHDVDRTGSRSLACVVRGGGIAAPTGASPPESIEVVACALLQTPHLRHFRATAERGALWKARVEQNFSVFVSSKFFGLF